MTGFKTFLESKKAKAKKTKKGHVEKDPWKDKFSISACILEDDDFLRDEEGRVKLFLSTQKDVVNCHDSVNSGRTESTSLRNTVDVTLIAYDIIKNGRGVSDDRVIGMIKDEGFKNNLKGEVLKRGNVTKVKLLGGDLDKVVNGIVRYRREAQYDDVMDVVESNRNNIIGYILKHNRELADVCVDRYLKLYEKNDNIAKPDYVNKYMTKLIRVMYKISNKGEDVEAARNLSMDDLRERMKSKTGSGKGKTWWDKKENQLETEIGKFIKSEKIRIDGVDKNNVKVKRTGKDSNKCDVEVSGFKNGAFAVEAKLNFESAKFAKFSFSIHRRNFQFSDNFAEVFNDLFPDRNFTGIISEIRRYDNGSVMDVFYQNMEKFYEEYNKFTDVLEEFLSLTDQSQEVNTQKLFFTREQLEEMTFPQDLVGVIDNMTMYLNVIAGIKPNEILSAAGGSENGGRIKELYVRILQNIYGIVKGDEGWRGDDPKFLNKFRREIFKFTGTNIKKRHDKIYKYLINPKMGEKVNEKTMLRTFDLSKEAKESFFKLINSYYYRKGARYIEVGNFRGKVFVNPTNTLDLGTLYVLEGPDGGQSDGDGTMETDPLNLMRNGRKFGRRYGFFERELANKDVMIVLELQGNISNTAKKEHGLAMSYKERNKNRLGYRMTLEFPNTNLDFSDGPDSSSNNGFGYLNSFLGKSPEGTVYNLSKKDATRKAEKVMTKESMMSFKEFLTEAYGKGVKTKDQESNKFEQQIAENITKFFVQTGDERYKNLTTEHYKGENAKYYSDIKITNPKNNLGIWVEVKKDKNACLGSPTFKYYDREWHVSSKDQDNPLSNYYLSLLNEHSQKFIQHCKNKLGDDFILPEDMADVIDSWRKSGQIDDTENDVNFITEKIPLKDFGQRIAEYYKTVKNEPVHYIQIDDNLYIIDPAYNPLGLATHDGKPLRSVSEVHKNGRVQFRAKGVEKMVDGKRKYFYSIVMDIKQTAKNNTGSEAEEGPEEGEYICSFKSPDRFPTVNTSGK